jgi:hypothetical protein
MNIKANDEKWIGQKFNKLTVIGFEFRNKRWLWKCKCECGGESVAYPNQVIRGKTKSCKCGRSVTFHNMHLKHGDAGTRLHSIWKDMRKRCNNPKSKSYKYYGGKGIRVCEEWDNYVNFKQWAMDNGYNDDLTIERIDNNKDYSPQNCKWIPFSEQTSNQTSNIYVEHDGKRMTVGKWCDELNLHRTTIYGRIRKGIPPKKALGLE